MKQIWVEKYRPKKIDQCILPDKIRETALKWVEAGHIPHLILSGPAGTGKTSLAYALAGELDANVLFINGSNEGRQLDTLRNDIVGFASGFAIDDKPRIIIIDEADYLTAGSVQPALRTIMEEFASTTRFILTCNHPDRLIDAIHSRCVHVRLDMPLKTLPMALQRALEILDAEGVPYSKQAVAEYIRDKLPDFRNALIGMQQYAADNGKIDTGIFVVNKDVHEFFEAMKKKNWKSAREWLAENLNNDADSFYRKMYEICLDEIQDNGKQAIAIMIIHDYMVKSKTVADTEINAAAFAAHMIKEVF